MGFGGGIVCVRWKDMLGAVGTFSGATTILLKTVGAK